jgi:hypothetical protein
MRTFEYTDFGLIECPLWGKADIRRPTERAQSRFAYNSIIAPPLPGNRKPGLVPGFFVSAIHASNVRLTLDKVHSKDMMLHGHQRPEANVINMTLARIVCVPVVDQRFQFRLIHDRRFAAEVGTKRLN